MILDLLNCMSSITFSGTKDGFFFISSMSLMLSKLVLAVLILKE